RAPGVKVYYLKPLCIEVDDELHFTSREEIDAAIAKIRGEVDGHFRRIRVPRAMANGGRRAVAMTTAIPRRIVQSALARRRRALDGYHAKLEFQRRRTALDAQRLHRKCRRQGCTFDDMLTLTNPLREADVIEQYSLEQKLS